MTVNSGQSYIHKFRVLSYCPFSHRQHAQCSPVCLVLQPTSFECHEKTESTKHDPHRKTQGEKEKGVQEKKKKYWDGLTKLEE